MPTDNILLFVLLIVNSLLVLAMAVILYSVIRQGRRIGRIAEETQQLANQAEEIHKAGEEESHQGPAQPPPAT